MERPRPGTTAARNDRGQELQDRNGMIESVLDVNRKSRKSGVAGVVVARSNPNNRIPTGRIEVVAEEVRFLTHTQPGRLHPRRPSSANEDTRLRYQRSRQAGPAEQTRLAHALGTKLGDDRVVFWAARRVIHGRRTVFGEDLDDSLDLVDSGSVQNDDIGLIERRSETLREEAMNSSPSTDPSTFRNARGPSAAIVPKRLAERGPARPPPPTQRSCLIPPHQRNDPELGGSTTDDGTPLFSGSPFGYATAGTTIVALRGGDWPLPLR